MATNKYVDDDGLLFFWLQLKNTKIPINKAILDTITAEKIANWDAGGEAADELDAVRTTANNAASAASTAQTTADNAASAANTAQSTANEAKTLAQGKSKSLVYLNIQAMVQGLNALGPGELKMGDNVFIVTLERPDFWVNTVSSTSYTYNYTTDEALIEDSKAANGVQIGYYSLSMLETQKVNIPAFETDSGNLKANGTPALGNSGLLVNSDHVHPHDSDKVDKTTTVNGKALSDNITLTQDDVGDGTTYKRVTSEEKTTWNNKQNALTFDSAPTSGSSNPVTSGGIFTAVNSRVPNTRKVNNKPLSEDLELTPTDIGLTPLTNAEIESIMAQ